MTNEKIVFRDASSRVKACAAFVIYDSGIGARIYLNFDEVRVLRNSMDAWLNDHSPCPQCGKVPCESPKLCNSAQRKESR